MARNFLLGVNPPDLADPVAFGAKYAGADAVVVTLPEDPAKIAAVKRALPGAIFLGYVNASDLPRRWSPDTYWQAFWAGFPASAFVTDLDTGGDFKMYPAVQPANDLSHYIPNAASNAFWATWCRDRIRTLGLDGLYWDNAHWRVGPYLLSSYAEHRLDMDHNGTADSPSIIAARHAIFRGALTQKVREAWPDAIQVCNSGGACPDPSVNGITVEVSGNQPLATADFDAAAWRRPVYAAAVSMDAKGDEILMGADLPEHVGVGFFTDRPARIRYAEWL